MKGININCKNVNYIDLILSGRKKIETRDVIKGKDVGSLHKYLGQRVGLIETGRGKAMLCGYATIVAIYRYNTKEEFDDHSYFHRVYEGDKFYFNGNVKFGYLLEDIEVLDYPVFVNTRGNVAREI